MEPQPMMSVPEGSKLLYSSISTNKRPSNEDILSIVIDSDHKGGGDIWCSVREDSTHQGLVALRSQFLQKYMAACDSLNDLQETDRLTTLVARAHNAATQISFDADLLWSKCEIEVFVTTEAIRASPHIEKTLEHLSQEPPSYEEAIAGRKSAGNPTSSVGLPKKKALPGSVYASCSAPHTIPSLDNTYMIIIVKNPEEFSGKGHSWIPLHLSPIIYKGREPTEIEGKVEHRYKEEYSRLRSQPDRPSASTVDGLMEFAKRVAAQVELSGELEGGGVVVRASKDAQEASKAVQEAVEEWAREHTVPILTKMNPSSPPRWFSFYGVPRSQEADNEKSTITDENLHYVILEGHGSGYKAVYYNLIYDGDHIHTGHVSTIMNGYRKAYDEISRLQWTTMTDADSYVTLLDEAAKQVEHQLPPGYGLVVGVSSGVAEASEYIMSRVKACFEVQESHQKRQISMTALESPSTSNWAVPWTSTDQGRGEREPEAVLQSGRDGFSPFEFSPLGLLKGVFHLSKYAVLVTTIPPRGELPQSQEKKIKGYRVEVSKSTVDCGGESYQQAVPHTMVKLAAVPRRLPYCLPPEVQWGAGKDRTKKREVFGQKWLSPPKVDGVHPLLRHRA
ncbi:hypothetical protein TREMEDRAFT_66565 [Tremella mesenterica DSM 1558]|uniref:uncharacterized protein n=1 Tax=Tremella mesenterica (strain ATCC 24925 / CBS 8224 / DSM 1558 / NBRC 9311 / NRRL Y-6157 / RJB 2259-6 / UBC 559-6) TaxID=578456 RepID=UPI00032CCA13|nr:uncharacterized protein TREMEDRAFT_66565 [Tremella mesenterica DSM 1558]EIW65435.1 hypothetical protein TREMEDRAFT_66565 [Tremella mesenterica DSM 1558]